jgi:hypothetical protein
VAPVTGLGAIYLKTKFFVPLFVSENVSAHVQGVLKAALPKYLVVIVR